MEDLEAVMEKIRECCGQEERIVAAYLFGSAVRGRMWEKSDIDVAVLVDREHEPDFPYLEFAVSLERSCGRAVDLILLNRAGELLKHHVRRYGRLVVDRDPRKRKQFEILSRKLYEDFLYLHKHAASGLYRRMTVKRDND